MTQSARPAAARPASGNAPPAFSGYQKFVVALLAFLQFTIILDFMILSPLGAILMPALKIEPARFGVVISVYAFSAGLSGLLSAGFADRFDRRKLLLFFYSGFLLGTLFCGLAPTYHWLLAARVVTGLFGGVIGSIVFAITTDLFPLEMRGRVMGVIQTAFSASQVLGIPAGLYFSNHWGWHAPFLMIVGIGAVVGALIAVYLRPIDAHLALRTERSPLGHLVATVANRRHLHAFSITALLATGGFMLMPFSSAFSVNNVGITLEQLPLVYLCTGCFTIVSGPLIGRLSDRFSKFGVFLFGSILSTVMILIYTNLGVTPLAWVIAVNIVLFVGISSRMIASQALLSAVPAPASRGSFMSVGSAIQQVSGGLASALAGLIVVSNGGRIEHFDRLGYIVVAATAATVLLLYPLNRRVMAARAA